MHIHTETLKHKLSIFRIPQATIREKRRACIFKDIHVQNCYFKSCHIHSEILTGEFVYQDPIVKNQNIIHV